jgi:hypothetical protein
VDKLSFVKQTLGTKTHKKCCHVGILEAIVVWPLASKMRAQ